MKLVPLPCLRCSTPVEVLEDAVKFGVLCEACIAKEIKEDRSKLREIGLSQAWRRCCPELYRDTALDLLPYPELSQKALRWPLISNPGKEIVPGTGLNLWGVPRTGKTRTLYLILKKEHFNGAAVKIYGPSEFAQECELRDWSTAQWIRALGKLDILAFDDIDKCKLSKSQEDKFFAVLDARIRNRKPVMFTHNSTGEELTSYFRSGKAIVERLRQHCTSIHFPEQRNLIS